MRKFMPIVFLSFLILTACARQEDTAQEQPPPQASSESTGTTTYVDGTYKFSFEYPSDWKQSYKDNFKVQFKPDDEKDKSKSSLAVWSGPSIAHDLKGLGKVCSKSTVQIAGQTIEKEIYCGLRDWDTGAESQPELKLITLYFTHEDIEYGLEFYMRDSSAYHYEQEVLDDVISSFRFNN